MFSHCWQTAGDCSVSRVKRGAGDRGEDARRIRAEALEATRGDEDDVSRLQRNILDLAAHHRLQLDGNLFRSVGGLPQQEYVLGRGIAREPLRLRDRLQ